MSALIPPVFVLAHPGRTAFFAAIANALRGLSTTNLRYFRTFHQVYAGRTPEIRHTPSGVLQDLSLAVEGQDAERGFSPALGWSHYRTLMAVGNRAERLFYEIEAEKES